MKKKIDVKIIIIAFLLMLVGIGGVTAASVYLGKDIGYDNTGTNLESNNVQDAIDEIYGKIKNDSAYDAAQVSFVFDSWETIQATVQSGDYIYRVGNTKTVDMGRFGIHVLRVANTTPCTNGETSETACGFVVEFADIITDYNMNSSGTTGGWRDSEMRTYVNGTIYNALPSDLRGVIANTTVVSGHGSLDTTNFTTTDKLYLLNAQEVWGTNSKDTSFGTSRQLDYYKNLGVTESNYSGAKKQYNGSKHGWWLRSAMSNNNIWFLDVLHDGRLNNNYPDTTLGVSPAFRIA